MIDDNLIMLRLSIFFRLQAASWDPEDNSQWYRDGQEKFESWTAGQVILWSNFILEHFRFNAVLMKLLVSCLSCRV